LADLIAEDLSQKFWFKSIDRYKVLAFAMYHDMEEVFTWDLITPVKNRNKEVKAGFEKLWELLLREEFSENFKWNEHISNRIIKAHKDYELRKDKDIENRIVKFADIIQSLWYVIKEVNLWNSYMEKVLKNIINSLIEKYSSSTYFRWYIKDILEAIEKDNLLKTNIIDIDWEFFSKNKPKD
jgi:5'-deoxynucleotidase YfbR-like HD superfamily hydrolase